MSESETPETCKHATINTWAFDETGEPAELWSCARCGVKFVPITNELRLERERDDALEALRPFAKLADDCDRWRHPDESTCAHRISAADLRRARAILAKVKP